MNSTTSTRSLLALAIMLLVMIGYQSLGAQGWTPPGSVPPGDNVAAPINVSASYQAKGGDLGAVRMRAGQYCNEDASECFEMNAGDSVLKVRSLYHTPESLLSNAASRAYWNGLVDETIANHYDPVLLSYGWEPNCRWNDSEPTPTSADTTGGSKTLVERRDWCGSIMCRFLPQLNEGGIVVSVQTEHCGNGAPACGMGRMFVHCIYGD